MEKKKTVKPSLKANTNVKANEDELVFKEETTTSITDKQQKEMLTLIKDLSSKVERLEAEKSNTTLPKEEILADDYLEIPATFFAYSVSFNLSGDIRRGKVSMNPNNGKSVIHTTGTIKEQQQEVLLLFLYVEQLYIVKQKLNG